MAESLQFLGFITIIENARLGLIGGYLVLNHAGRPVEFHCTTPVRANRAQEILYGATLKPFLYGEQIAQTLVQKAKIKPDVIFADISQVLTLQDFTDIPVVFVPSNAKSVPKLKITLLSNSDFEENCNGSIGESPETLENGEKYPYSISEQLAEVPGLINTRWSEQKIASQRVAVPEISNHSVKKTVAGLETVSHAIDFTEPFVRIRLAIEEAQKAA
ncbi:MAG: hypothetical protein FWC50_05760 [Planctomycetaceae bacterium]|nr:hypothetical protein [Planctomycetaceae bacterium]